MTKKETPTTPAPTIVYENVTVEVPYNVTVEVPVEVPVPVPAPAPASEDDGLDMGVIIALVVLGAGVLLVGSFLVFLIRREKTGRPMFSPLMSAGPDMSNPQQIGGSP